MTGPRSGRATWILGLIDGLLPGFLALVFFIFGLIGLALIVGLTYAFFRSLPLVSGMLVGAGGVVGGLMVRQSILICDARHRPPGHRLPAGSRLDARRWPR